MVKTAKAFTKAAAAKPEEAQKLQAGQHLMRTQISGEAALEMLLDPSRIKRNFVQLREGYSLERQIKQLAKATGIPEKEFAAAAKKGDALGPPPGRREAEDSCSQTPTRFPTTRPPSGF